MTSLIRQFLENYATSRTLLEEDARRVLRLKSDSRAAKAAWEIANRHNNEAQQMLAQLAELERRAGAIETVYAPRNTTPAPGNSDHQEKG